MIDTEIRRILETERERARVILAEHRAQLVAMRDLLVDRKVIERAAFAHLVTT
jgi:cell division protease FtsH